MTEISFFNVVIVAVVAFAAPLALGLIQKLRLPAVVLEIVLGIAVGPSGLGWVKSDLPVQVLALLELSFSPGFLSTLYAATLNAAPDTYVITASMTLTIIISIPLWNQPFVFLAPQEKYEILFLNLHDRFSSVLAM
jgi:Kef-type K+ transport system membrane component KefB